jgi:hypothetical protein
MTIRSKFPFLLCLTLFATFFATLPLFAAHKNSRNSIEDKMSASGRLAVRVRKAMQAAGIKSFASVKAGLAAEDRDACINTSDDCEDGFSEGPAGGQAETSIAVDRTGKHIVVGFNDTRGFSHNPLSVSGFMYSDDGGKTFVDGGQLPSPGDSSIGTTKLPQVFGDPDVKYLGGCNFVYSSILIAKFADTAVQTMGVHRSTDCGHTWTGPFEVTAATNPNGQLDQGEPVDAADKEFMDVDPDTGRVLLTWSNFTATSVEMSSTYSDDLLSGNPPTWSARQIISGTAADGQASIPRFAGNGSSNAYVAWRRFPASLGNSIAFAKSTDNGKTWGAPIDVTAPFFTMDQVLGNDRVNTSPSLAVDKSRGFHRGNIYLVYSNNNSEDGADVYFQRSTNKGATFSSPIILNSRPGRDRAQWFPWVTVDDETGRVFVFYYDQGVARSGDLTQVSYLFSDSGGKFWLGPFPLTKTPFKAGWGNDTGQPNLGDYNQGIAMGNKLLAVWAGTFQVGFSDGQPSTSLSVPDIFFQRAPGFSDPVDLPVSAGMHPAPKSFDNTFLVGKKVMVTPLLEEKFDEPNLTPGTLPPGWIAAHGAGANVVPWVTSSAFCGATSNAAFHQEQEDGPANGSPSRWERLISPAFAVPADSDLVTMDFDVCYDTEDDPNFNILAYDGFFLRVTDVTSGHTLRSVLAEAFEKEFTTGRIQHYPKHFPRSGDPAYFEDMSAWSGDSQGLQHVHMEFPGMEGTTAQLRFEYAQDVIGTCVDVRPGHSCGVSIDNIEVRSLKKIH